MHGKLENRLIVIENGLLHSYELDDKKVWEVGRPSKDNIPDIKLYSTTVSRKHGRFQNMDGTWFYVDGNGKNGTVYNDKRITSGIRGRVKPILLSDGDIFVFGGGEEAIISPKTIWALFTERNYGNDWRVVDTKGLTTLSFLTEEDINVYEKPSRGMVVKKDKGMAIYMGDITYLSGEISVSGR